MKKIISSILFIVAIILVHSCRQQDDEAITELQRMNEQVLPGFNYKSADTAEIIIPPVYPKTIYPGTDPPPKDHDQWRNR